MKNLMIREIRRTMDAKRLARRRRMQEIKEFIIQAFLTLIIWSIWLSACMFLARLFLPIVPVVIGITFIRYVIKLAKSKKA